MHNGLFYIYLYGTIDSLNQKNDKAIVVSDLPKGMYIVRDDKNKNLGKFINE